MPRHQRSLYDLIKDVHPVVGEVVRPAIQSDMLLGKDGYGVYKVTVLDELKKMACGSGKT